MKTLLLLIISLPMFGQVTLDPDVQYDIRNATRIILQEESFYNMQNQSGGDISRLFVGKTEDEVCEIIADIVDVNVFKIKELRKADLYDIPFTTGYHAGWVNYQIEDVVFGFHTYYGKLQYWNGKKWKTIQRSQESTYFMPYTQYRVLYSDDKSVFRYYNYSTQSIHAINTNL